jgi:hypothetical protein
VLFYTPTVCDPPPQPGGQGHRIYVPHEQGGPLISSGTGFPFRRLLRLAGLLITENSVSTVVCVPVAAGTCLPSRCPETDMVYPPVLQSLHSNGTTRYNINSIVNTIPRIVQNFIPLSMNMLKVSTQELSPVQINVNWSTHLSKNELYQVSCISRIQNLQQNIWTLIRAHL